MQEITISISGLGLILYSPPAVAHIPEGSDYLQDSFLEPADVARHVVACQLTAFCTGSPGVFRLLFTVGQPDESAIQAAAFKLRLGLQARGGTVCVRDLYDLHAMVGRMPSRSTVGGCKWVVSIDRFLIAATEWCFRRWTGD